MVNGKRKAIFLAVTVAVIANLLLGNNVSAKKLELNSNDVERIKLVLDLTKLISSIVVSDDKLKTVLDMTTKGAGAGADITYGLLVLTSLNEMDFIDSVVSQRYKEEANAYFNSILDERTNLRNYYKGIGYDLPRVVMGRITSPMAAMTLNTFEITDKTIQIITEINVLKEEMRYDGLWTYFDFRKGNESHEFAWEMAETKMGYTIINSNPLRSRAKQQEKIHTSLESQFAALYEKWGPYVEMNKGVKEEFKKQVRGELASTLAVEIKNQKLVEGKREPSLLEKVKLVWQALTKEAEKIGSGFKDQLSEIGKKIQGLTGLGGAQVSQIEIVSELPAQVEPAPLGEIIKEIETVSQKIEEVKDAGKEQETFKTSLELDADATQTEISAEEEENKEIIILNSGEERLCEKAIVAQAAGNKVIFQEIAWMGNQNSANDEWMKLKNISDGEVDLTGWRILDKDQQIKIVFDNQHRALINELFLLERTNDDSLPGVAADLIYTGALNDTDETLYLFDNNCQLQDEVAASPDWPGGEKVSRQPMKRNSDLTWQQNEPAEPAVVFNYGEPATPSQQPIKILISEIQISPIGERFIELYNPNSETVNLTGWYIQRKTQTGSDFTSFVSSTHFEGKTISALGYFLVASSSQADIIMGLTLTEGNSLILKNSNQEIIDKVGWGQAREFEAAPTANPESGKSVGRKNNLDTDNNQNDFETQTPTPENSSRAIVAFFVSGGNATNSATTTEEITQTETPSLSVVINEIAWMGTSAANYSDEWLELYNNSSSTVDLAGWMLKAADGNPSATFSGANGTTTIPAGGLFLLERTNSGTTNVAEDYIFTGALSNDGEKLELRNASNTLIDLVDFSAGWPAGSSTPYYISMERISATTTATSSTNWASNNLLTRNGLDASGNKINGTPKAQNSVSVSSTAISSLADLFSEFTEITLTSLGDPYLIQNDLTVPVGNTLKIETGTTLKFNSSKKLEINGRLEAAGAVFAANSDSPGKGFWQGISLSNALNSKIENTTIRYGKVAVEIKSGISLIKNNIFEENETPILLSGAASTTFFGNSAQQNTINGILVDASTITANAVWQSNLPYVTENKAIAAGATLTIKEGTVVKLKRQSGGNYTSYWNVYGKLITEGTLANPVVITYFSDDEYGGDANNDGASSSPVKGEWRYLKFHSLTATSTLDGLILRYGGGNCSGGFCWGGITQSQGVGIEIKNSRIEKNIWGIFSNESNCQNVFQKIKLENTTFSQNDINVYQDSGNQCAP